MAKPPLLAAEKRDWEDGDSTGSALSASPSKTQSPFQRPPPFLSIQNTKPPKGTRQKGRHRARTRLFLDWDGTLTTHSTLSLIASVFCHSAEAGAVRLRPYTQAWTADYRRRLACYVPTKWDRRTLAQELAWLDDGLEDVERRSVERMEKGGLFRPGEGRDSDGDVYYDDDDDNVGNGGEVGSGSKAQNVNGNDDADLARKRARVPTRTRHDDGDDVEHAITEAAARDCSRVQLRRGALTLFRSVISGGGGERGSADVISVGWSAHWIRNVLCCCYNDNKNDVGGGGSGGGGGGGDGGNFYIDPETKTLRFHRHKEEPPDGDDDEDPSPPTQCDATVHVAANEIDPSGSGLLGRTPPLEGPARDSFPSQPSSSSSSRSSYPFQDRDMDRGGGKGIWTAGDKKAAMLDLMTARGIRRDSPGRISGEGLFSEKKEEEEDGDEDERTEEDLSVYIGDSPTDLACLLLADVGVCIRDEPLGSEQAELKETLERLDVPCGWIGEPDEGAEGERGLFWAKDFEEIRAWLAHQKGAI